MSLVSFAIVHSRRWSLVTFFVFFLKCLKWFPVSTPYQRSLLSFRMRSRSSMSSRASSSLDLVVTMSCSLTLQICLISALSFRCRRWRFGFFIYENVQYFLSEYHCLLLSWMRVRRAIRSWVQSLAGPATFFHGD